VGDLMKKNMAKSLRRKVESNQQQFLADEFQRIYGIIEKM
jgi:hypothetical protein